MIDPLSSRLARIAIVTAFSLQFAACAEPAGNERPVVIVTIPPQAFLIERMAGELLEVRTMVANGQSPEDYQPLPQQLAAMAGAEFYFSAGVPSESLWLPKMRETQPDTRIVPMHAGLEGADPHHWTDPARAIVMANNAYAHLQSIYPGSQNTLAGNHAELVAELQQLDARIRALMAARTARRFLVYHPAWTHFAGRYGLEQIAFEREGKEPGARYLAQLLALCRENNVQTVFAQPQSSAAHARRFAREIDATLVQVDPLAYDYVDNLWEVAQAIAGALW